MRQLIAEKFLFPALAQALIDTGSVDLIEGNTWGDRFWGAVAGPAPLPDDRTPTSAVTAWSIDGVIYTGENWLGRLLMERRSVLQVTRRESKS